MGTTVQSHRRNCTVMPKTCRSEFDRLGIQVLLDHQRHFEGDGVLEFAQIQTRQLADFLQTVNQRIPVDKQLSGGFGHVQIVLEEALNGQQSFAVKRFETAALEHFLQEHLAQRGRKLIDQTADAEILVADDALLGFEHLSHIQSDLRFLVGARQILDVLHDGGNTDGNLGVSVSAMLVAIFSTSRVSVPGLMSLTNTMSCSPTLMT